jgi:hypothetical protein
MSANVSDRLKAALEQLDEAIDRLDACVTRHLEQAAETPPGSLVTEKLDRMIERIELALAE